MSNASNLQLLLLCVNRIDLLYYSYVRIAEALWLLHTVLKMSQSELGFICFLGDIQAKSSRNILYDIR